LKNQPQYAASRSAAPLAWRSLKKNLIPKIVLFFTKNKIQKFVGRRRQKKEADLLEK